ncbi:MAG: SprB repeat-containing protein [Bacteroidetes bacterium]|nr:SprB repeat-containing protein [Bacteroidota bacterium]
MPPGTYTVTVTDANNCTVTASTTIASSTTISASISNQTAVRCYGMSDGTVTVAALGGTLPYQFNIGSGNQLSGSFTGLSMGNYIVTVTDAVSCTATVSVSISEPVVLTLSETNTGVLCNGGTTGAINLTVLGGTLPYGYSWSNGVTTEDISGLGVGTYSVTVTDGNGCSANLSVNITQPVALNLSVTNTGVLCNGGTTGTIDLTVSGGTLPYGYNWSNGLTTEDLTNLGVGTYTVTVTDGNGCTATLSIAIAEPLAIVLSETHTDVLCNGGTTGTIDLTVSGGTLPYGYTWSNGSTTEDINSLGVGSYTVTVTDGNGCTATLSIAIAEPLALVLSETHTDVLCNGGTTGTIDLTVSGGILPYGYNWSNGSTTEDLTNLGVGTYTVTVTDGNGCTATLSIAMAERLD